MSSQSGVCNGNLGNEGLGSVDVGFGDLLAQASNFADLFEEDHFARLVAVDTDTCGVITSVLLAGKSVTEDLADRLPVLEW